MTTPPEASSDRAKLLKRTSAGVVSEARKLWRGVEPSRISASWRAALPRLMTVIAGAQLLAAETAEDYVSDALGQQDITKPVEGILNPLALVGVASDGWPLATLLFQPALAAMSALAEGLSRSRAMQIGYADLEMITRTQVADAFRTADSVAGTARRVTMYTRVLTPPSCSRCVVLITALTSWSTPFKRHPACDCIMAPTNSTVGQSYRSFPKDYFDSLSRAEQDRVFTKAGAQAIRDGADMDRVVNARRRAAGMRSAGDYARTRRQRRRRGTEWAQLTATEGAVAGRGRLRRRETLAGDHFVTFEDPLSLPGGGVAPRLMPESIYELAENQEHAIRLLKRHGYID